jgi:hypothetical protein
MTPSKHAAFAGVFGDDDSKLDNSRALIVANASSREITGLVRLEDRYRSYTDSTRALQKPEKCCH